MVPDAGDAMILAGRGCAAVTSPFPGMYRKVQAAEDTPEFTILKAVSVAPVRRDTCGGETLSVDCTIREMGITREKLPASIRIPELV